MSSPVSKTSWCQMTWISFRDQSVPLSEKLCLKSTPKNTPTLHHSTNHTSITTQPFLFVFVYYLPRLLWHQVLLG